MFFAILFLLPAPVAAYVAWRTASVPWVARRWPRRQVWAAGGSLWAALIAGMALGHRWAFPGSGWVDLAAMTLLGLLFLTFVALLGVDLVTGFGLWFRPAAPRLRGWALAAGLGLAGIATVQGLRSPEMVDHEVPLPGLPRERDGLVLVALSDLHLGTLLGPDWLAARLAQVRALEPDLVVLLGDTFEGHGRPDPRSVAALRTLHAPLGVWGVDGNHEHYGLQSSPLEEAGIHVLRDALAVPAPGLTLAGRAETGQRTSHPPWLPPAPPPGALVLLSHRPVGVEAASRAGVGLMLSGHTHGGQLWPFGLLVAQVHPTLAGRTQVGALTLIVSRGTGTWGPRMRLWRRGEISRIRLRSAPSAP